MATRKCDDTDAALPRSVSVGQIKKNGYEKSLARISALLLYLLYLMMRKRDNLGAVDLGASVPTLYAQKFLICASKSFQVARG